MLHARFTNEGPVPAPALKNSDLRDSAPRRKCLLIEDSAFDQQRVGRLVTGVAAFDLTAVSTLAEARAALSRQDFDLLLLDNALPDGLGVDFALGLRKRPKYRTIPIMIVSDFPSPFMYDKALMARVSQVVTKSDLRPRHVRKLLEKC